MFLSSMVGSQKWQPRKSQVKRVLPLPSQVNMESAQWSMGAGMNSSTRSPRSRVSPAATVRQGRSRLVMSFRCLAPALVAMTWRSGHSSTSRATLPEWSGSLWFMIR